MARTLGAGGQKQIVVVPAGLPGGPDAIFTSLVTISVASSTDSTGNTVIPDIGLLHFMPLASSTVVLEMQTALNTWTQIWSSTTIGFTWQSDATNLRFRSTDTTTTRSGTYYVIE